MGAKNLKFLLALPLLAGVLTGCMGGPVARQFAQSLAMRAADNAVERAIQQSAPVPQQNRTNQLLMNNNPNLDPYQAAFLRAQLRTPTPPLNPELPPASAHTPDPALSAEAKVTQLATFEIWSIVIGPEKHAMLESIRDLGIARLPPEQQWEQWQLVEGGTAGTERPMLILVPPEIGQMKSGDFAVVELGTTDGFYIARDRLAP
jgi:hypothetical protein